MTTASRRRRRGPRAVAAVAVVATVVVTADATVAVGAGAAVRATPGAMLLLATRNISGAASLVAVAAISWSWVGSGVVNGPAGAQLAQQQPVSGPVLASAAPSGVQQASTLTPTRVIVGNGKPQVMLRDPRLDQLLEAHQQAGGASQMPSGFLRNATFEGPTR